MTFSAGLRYLVSIKVLLGENMISFLGAKAILAKTKTEQTTEALLFTTDCFDIERYNSLEPFF